jgi:hypothetical protein
MLSTTYYARNVRYWTSMASQALDQVYEKWRPGNIGDRCALTANDCNSGTNGVGIVGRIVIRLWINISPACRNAPLPWQNSFHMQDVTRQDARRLRYQELPPRLR